jgi:hypothetical protein
MVALLVFAAILPIPRQFSGTKMDPDRFYHFAISKIYATSGFPKTLPQAEDVGWGDAFAEKEFLFHVLTGLGHKIGGEMGVLWVTWAFYAAMAATFGFIFGYSVNSLWLVPLGAIAMMTTTGVFSLRMMMVRPHVLAILLMTLQMFAWVRGRWAIACMLEAIYVLAYHAFYVPLVISGVFLAAQYAAGEPIKRKALWAFGGVLIAILINPAFPYNVSTAIQHASIVLTKGGSVQVPDFAFGVELRKLPSDEMLKRHGFYLLLPFVLLSFALFKGLWRANQPSSWRPLKQPSLAASLIIAMIFAVLTFLTPRAYEILVPAVFIAVATTAQIFRLSAPMTLGFFAACALAMGSHTYRILDEIKTTDLRSEVNDDVGQLLAQIPKDQPAKVFNVNWDMAPFIFYHRPDLKFVDLLDPTFLARHNADLFDIKLRLLTGRHPDPWLAVRGDFHADYVLASQDKNWAFERPMFEPMTPPNVKDSKKLRYRLFKVRAERPDRFITAYDYGVAKIDQSITDLANSAMNPSLTPITAVWPSPQENATTESTPTNDQTNDQTNDSLKRVFLDTFGTWLEQNPSQTAALNSETHSICMHAKPLLSDVLRVLKLLPEVRYLGVGGGPALSVWSGQTPLFKAPLAETIRPIHYLLDVTSMTLQDLRSLEFLVCAPPNSRLSGLVVSFWSDADLAQLCPAPQRKQQDPTSKPWFAATQETDLCFGATTLIHKK